MIWRLQLQLDGDVTDMIQTAVVLVENHSGHKEVLYLYYGIFCKQTGRCHSNHSSPSALKFAEQRLFATTFEIKGRFATSRKFFKTFGSIIFRGNNNILRQQNKHKFIHLQNFSTDSVPCRHINCMSP